MRTRDRCLLAVGLALAACSDGGESRQASVPAGPVVDRFGRELFPGGERVDYRLSPSGWVARSGQEFSAADGPARAAVTPPPSERRRGGAPGYTLMPYANVLVGSWPEAVAIGDVTGDDVLDVVMTTTFYFDAANDYHVFVFPQLAGGVLGPPTSYPYLATASRNGLVLADLDEDGLLDVVVGHGSGISVLLADGAGGLDPATVVADADADTLAAMDVNRDCHVDVISLGWSRGASIFYGDGNGGFSSIDPLATNAAGYNDHEVEDLNDDGLTDLAVMSGQGGADLSVHDHDGIDGFLGPQTYPADSPNGVGLGDVTGDGLHDAVLSRATNSPTWLEVFAQDASGILQAPMTVTSYDIPEPVEVADIDGDCREDVAVAHGGWLKVGIYLQDAAGNLGAEQLYDIPYASHYAPQGLAVGDFSSDDCADVAIADYNYGLVTLYGANCAGSGCSDPDGGCPMPPDGGVSADVSPDLAPDASPDDGPLPEDAAPADAPAAPEASVDASTPADAATQEGDAGSGAAADGCGCGVGRAPAGLPILFVAILLAVRRRRAA